MANKNVFKTEMRGVPVANTTTSHGTPAYKHDSEHALAQLAATGCFNDTFYASGEDQLRELDLVSNVSSEFLAKTAVYARGKAFMKDMPVFLMACLASRGASEHGTSKQGESAALFRKVFPKVINNGKMLRNFAQILRSGVVSNGRVFNLSANTVVRKCINEFLNSVNLSTLFRWSVGNDPTLGDVIRMTRPRPNTEERAALFQYLLNNTRFEENKGKTYFKGGVLYEHDHENLPEVVRQYEAFKKDKSLPMPSVDFRMLEGLGLSPEQWKTTAWNASWTETRMNLNKYNRHGVFDDAKLVEALVNRLIDPDLIKKSGVFPYQLMAAYKHATDVPLVLREALQDAMEIATENVPQFNSKVHVCIDHSYSMSSSITGNRYGSTSKMRCVDVAALITAVILRNNKGSQVLPFNTRVNKVNLNPRDTVLTNADILARMCNGGTACSAPLEFLNQNNDQGDLVVFVSDNESWFDSRGYNDCGPAQEEQWRLYKHRNPKAKLVCVDLVPNTHCQVKQRTDVLNIGGFSDTVFEVIAGFMESNSSDHWVDVIKSVEL